MQIVPFIADGLTIFLFVQFFKDLPRELIEACRVEGATWFQIYWRVVMPLSGPVIATAAILKFLYMYNQYLWPLMVTQAEEYRPVMVGLQYFFQLNTGLGRAHGLPLGHHRAGAHLLPGAAARLHLVDRLDRRERAERPT